MDVAPRMGSGWRIAGKGRFGYRVTFDFVTWRERLGAHFGSVWMARGKEAGSPNKDKFRETQSVECEVCAQSI